MKILFTIAILLSAVKAMACMCSPLPEFKTTEDLKIYDFIALVDIKELAPMANFGLRADGDIKINVIELVKGKATNLAVDPSFNSSCALSFKEAEQWLFFGVLRNNRIEVSMCTYTMRYRQVSGLREWWHFNGLKELDVLRSIFNTKVLTGNRAKVLYPNGKVEIEQSFKNGKLNGLRKIYMPDGNLYITEQFKNGKRVGERKSFFASGQLSQETVYKDDWIFKNIRYQFVNDGKPKESGMHDIELIVNPEKYPDEIRRWTDSLRSVATSIAFEQVFANDGRSYSINQYFPNKKIAGQISLDWNKQIYESTGFNEEGKVVIHTIRDKNADQEKEQETRPDGTLRELNNKCHLCRIYFDASRLPEATPEKIIIQ
ncbi:hypothetical protein [Mucilaginibacter antarcticus]|uniref:Antitoxin component YwqK of YwqJK toxin-antitoxin module n=1 Tax=Mucilaginibacter antarcticus TaxID=1855725 RepID=A0ABW5XU79_9SPHI